MPNSELRVELLIEINREFEARLLRVQPRGRFQARYISYPLSREEYRKLFPGLENSKTLRLEDSLNITLSETKTPATDRALRAIHVFSMFSGRVNFEESLILKTGYDERFRSSTEYPELLDEDAELLPSLGRLPTEPELQRMRDCLKYQPSGRVYLPQARPVYGPKLLYLVRPR